MVASNSVSRALRCLLKALNHVSCESLHCSKRALISSASNPAGSSNTSSLMSTADLMPLRSSLEISMDLRLLSGLGVDLGRIRNTKK